MVRINITYNGLVDLVRQLGILLGCLTTTYEFDNGDTYISNETYGYDLVTGNWYNISNHDIRIPGSQQQQAAPPRRQRRRAARGATGTSTGTPGETPGETSGGPMRGSRRATRTRPRIPRPSRTAEQEEMLQFTRSRFGEQPNARTARIDVMPTIEETENENIETQEISVDTVDGNRESNE